MGFPPASILTSSRTSASAHGDDWHPEDHALYSEESIVAKDTDRLPAVTDYLRKNTLPWEMTRLWSARHKL